VKREVPNWFLIDEELEMQELAIFRDRAAESITVRCIRDPISLRPDIKLFFKSVTSLKVDFLRVSLKTLKPEIAVALLEDLFLSPFIVRLEIEKLYA